MKQVYNKSITKAITADTPKSINWQKLRMSILFLLLSSLLVFTSCESYVGPPGPPGRDGIDGESFLGTVFEIEDDFTPGNDYKIFYEFPLDFTVYDTDVVLVYLLWEQVGSGNDALDVWRLLPQTIVLNDGLLQYNFDYTMYDVEIFLEGDTDFNKLLPAETDNQVFRIVVFPADFRAEMKHTDISEFGNLLKSPAVKLNSFSDFNLDKDISLTK